MRLRKPKRREHSEASKFVADCGKELQDCCVRLCNCHCQQKNPDTANTVSGLETSNLILPDSKVVLGS